MINHKIGYGNRAERTLDFYAAAVLAEQVPDRSKPGLKWRDMMRKLLSDISWCDGVEKG
jgi:phosphoenolpyruvate carboxylase